MFGIKPKQVIASIAIMIAVYCAIADEPQSFKLIDDKSRIAKFGKSEYNMKNVDDPKHYNKNDARLINLEEIGYAPSPADATAYALADSITIPKADRPFYRYVWVVDGNKKSVGGVNYTINLSWNRSSVLVRCQPTAQDRLVRVDLRSLAPRADIEGKDFKELFKLWEQLAFEPYFHITRTTDDALPTDAKLIKSLDDDPPGSIRFSLDGKDWYKSPAGRTSVYEENGWRPQKIEFAKKANIAVPGVHVGLDQHVMLQGILQTSAPIVRHDWFIIKSLTTLNGGLYYDLIGVERKPAKGTALDAFFEKFGYDPKEVAKLRADQRVALFKSNVTGRPRRVDFFRGIGVRPESGTGLGTITFDPSEEQIAAENDPIRNLLDFKSAASEVILERSNGIHVFGLFNAAGELQDSAPDNVVKDHAIPIPYTARLQSAISCIRCHNPFDGWQPVSNDVKKMLSGYLDVFDDLADKKGVVPDVLDRLAGLYSGDLAKPLRRARDDYSDVVFAVTGGQSVPQAGANLAGVFVEYSYTDVDAAIACRELGYNVPADKAVYYLNAILPPLSKDIIGISPEDPILGALKAGLKVQRFQWESVYADAAFRASQSKIKRGKSVKR